MIIDVKRLDLASLASERKSDSSDLFSHETPHALTEDDIRAMDKLLDDILGIGEENIEDIPIYG